MTDLNKVTLIGRIVRDAELKMLENGSAKLDFSVAFNTTKKVGADWVDESNFTDLTVWGKQAEAIQKFMTKGKQVAIEGHLKQERWEKDGQKLSKLKVVLDSIQLLGGSSSKTSEETIPDQTDFNEDMPF